MRILITGASGFLGSRVMARLVAGGHEVHGTARRPVTDSGGHWHEADLLDPAQRHDLVAAVAPSHLIHLAWTTEHGAFWESPLNRDWGDATIDLLERFARVGGKRALVAGSCAEYDWSDPRLATGLCDEATTRLAPATPYGRAKLDTFYRATELGDTTGLAIVWARLFFLFGHGEHPDRLVPALIRAGLQGENLELRHPDRVLDFMSADEASAALVAVATSDMTGAVNVASGVGVRLRDLAAVINRLARGDEAVFDPPAETPDTDPLRLVAAVKRLSTEAGFDPKYDLEAKLAPVVAWWRRQSE